MTCLHVPPSSATVPARLSVEHRTGSYYPVGKDRLLTADEQAIPADLGSQSVSDLDVKFTLHAGEVANGVCA
jgi:hypothetical protein